MNMQGTSMPDMGNMHDTFWHEDQVVVTFYSEEAVTIDTFYKTLYQYKSKLNDFLAQHNLHFTLNFFFDDNEIQRYVEASASKARTSGDERVADSTLPGIYFFSLLPTVRPTFPVPVEGVKIQTAIGSFFQLSPNGKAQNTLNSTMAENGSADDDDEPEDHDSDDRRRRRRPSKIGPVPQIVNLFNKNLARLNLDLHYNVQILSAAPAYFCGATPGVTQGCPAVPPVPVPVDASCPSSPGLWPIELPRGKQSSAIGTGEGVKVFILDALPKLADITRAANAAGANNKLLLDVATNVTFRYDYDNLVDAVDPSGSDQVTVGKDIFGRHSTFNMPDHGLFIAGIVRSLASDASVECIRVLNDYCVGDLNVLLRALQDIHDRMSEGGDLHKKPVVINLSLVIPTDDEAKQKGVKPKVGGHNITRTELLAAIQSLVEMGAVFAASAGNEGDRRGNPSARRPGALYPGAFANDKVKGIIAVGATNHAGNPAKYSCYPGTYGIATYGGEIPKPLPARHPARGKTTPGCSTRAEHIDALIGVYSSTSYPSLSINDCDPTYPAPDDYGWAYWVGTSFATPIISALLACIMEKKGVLNYTVSLVVHLTNAVAASPIRWTHLDSKISPSGVEIGRKIQVVQCSEEVEEEDTGEEVEVEVEEVIVVVEE